MLGMLSVIYILISQFGDFDFFRHTQELNVFYGLSKLSCVLMHFSHNPVEFYMFCLVCQLAENRPVFINS